MRTNKASGFFFPSLLGNAQMGILKSVLRDLCHMSEVVTINLPIAGTACMLSSNILVFLQGKKCILPVLKSISTIAIWLSGRI